jgi:hypothetical protein
MPRVREGLEVGPDRFDVDPLGGHVQHPGLCHTASGCNPRLHPRRAP